MHTKDQLAAALREVGLDGMADNATRGWYHDFLSPFDMPVMKLLNDLAVAARNYPDRSEKIMILRERVKQGQFDASKEESDEWAESDEGQEAFSKLIRKP